jgi:hypothetical protein
MKQRGSAVAVRPVWHPRHLCSEFTYARVESPNPVERNPLNSAFFLLPPRALLPLRCCLSSLCR